jgi:hypothetical protein
MSRYSDIGAASASIDPMPLPVVDWLRIGARPPRRRDFAYGGPIGALPKADVVVITWTAAEWSALDHVFLNSNGTRLSTSTGWQNGWYPYMREAPPVPIPPPVLAPANAAPALPFGPPPPLWGLFAMVEIDSAGGPLTVMLFKSNAHLAHAPGLSTLAAMTERIIEEAQPRYVYSIGTAGGARADQKLGDVIFTNCGTLRLQSPINAAYFDLNGQTYGCTDWFVSDRYFQTARDNLFFSLGNVISYPSLQSLVGKLHAQVPGSAAIALDDVINDCLLPEKLLSSDIVGMKDVPLLSTDFYFIAEDGDGDKFSFLEMDDAVIAKVAVERGVKCAFGRNVSDPIVPIAGVNGEPLPPEIRKRWSGLIYETYGFYTAANGAIAAWATIAAIDERG